MQNARKLALVAKTPFETSVVGYYAQGLSSAEIAEHFADVSAGDVESTLKSLDQRAAQDYRDR
jgi:uncharacterized protein (DUF433 family)